MASDESLHRDASSSWRSIAGELEAIERFLRATRADYFSPSAEGVALFRGLLTGDDDSAPIGDLNATEKRELLSELRRTVLHLGERR